MKTETKVSHTPGPWSVKVDGTMTGRGPVIVADGAYYDDGSEREIAELETSETRDSLCRNPKARWRRNPDYAEILANAKLFAAAPDLLSACREAYNAAMYLFSNEGGSTWSGLAKQLHDAIAKATGETV